jgi:hypothetical protein
MLVSGIQGFLFPFEQGDCADYRTWVLADRGIKEEQTSISEQNQRLFSKILANAAREPDSLRKFKRRGNIFFPE